MFVMQHVSFRLKDSLPLSRAGMRVHCEGLACCLWPEGAHRRRPRHTVPVEESGDGWQAALALGRLLQMQDQSFSQQLENSKTTGN